MTPFHLHIAPAVIVGCVFGMALARAVAASERFAQFAQDVRRAMTLADLPLTSAAIDMGITHPLLVQQLSGEGHLSMRRLALIQNADFFRWLWLLQAQRHGLPAPVVTARHAAHALTMSIPHAAETERAS